MPATSRPPDSRSTVEICRARVHGRRRASGVTIAPILIWLVAIAMAARVVQASPTAICPASM
jgi:hypothetical protein